MFLVISINDTLKLGESLMNIMRSLMFVPGNRKDMLEKSLAFDADIIVPDMQDSVPLSEKQSARDVIHDMLPVLADANKKIIVRVNSMDTGFLEDDIKAVIGPYIFGLNIVNINTPEDVIIVEKLVVEAEKKQDLEQGSIKFIIYLESALGVVNAYNNCLSSNRIIAAAFGAEDFTLDMGVNRTDAGNEISVPRSLVAIAATAANVVPIDVVYANFKDMDGFEKDVMTGKNMGYKGKFSIHPTQLDPINKLFSPNAEEIEYASRVVKAFEDSLSRGRGATAIDGKMVDYPVVKRAQNILDTARVISGDV
jgi:citrate lyase subunit beta/citryl-CoA lyase